MKINQIIVLKETREGEGRVALTPSTVATLTAKNFRIQVESDAGVLAGFKDEDYLQAGAEIFKLGTESFPSNSLFLRVKRPIKERELLENKLFSPNSIMMGFLDPFDVNHENHIANWNALGLKIISLEVLPFSADDPRNAQAAMSHLAGRLALEHAVREYKGSLPKKVTVIGTGPAGLSAALTAKDLQLPVQLFGRKEKYRQTIEKAGITYFVLPENNQKMLIRNHLSDQTIVIAAARVIGKKSPLLIDEASVKVLPDNASLVDLSTGEGGCIVESKEDALIKVERGISIINVSGYPKAEPKKASEAFALCIVNLLLDLINSDGDLDLQKSGQRNAYKNFTL